MGDFLAAWRAGYKPKITPMAVATKNAVKIASHEIDNGHSAKLG